MAKTLNIVHCVESYAPALGGMAEVVKQLSERMVTAGHNVSVFTSNHTERSFGSLNGVVVRSFDLKGNAVNGITGSDKEAYTTAIQSAEIDIIVFFAAQQWSADLALPILDKIKAKKVFVPTGFSMLYNPAYQAYFENMKSWLHGMDMNVFLAESYRDVDFAKAAGISKQILIPNGAAEEEFLSPPTSDTRKQFGIPTDHLLILHVGSFVSSKGQREAMDIFYRADTGPATLLMIGNGAEHFHKSLYRRPWLFATYLWNQLWKRKRVIFVAMNRSATVDAYKAADLFLFPSHIECSPIVLFEAMASGTPFLATAAGNSEEIVRWSGGGQIMPTIALPNGYCEPDITGSARELTVLVQEKEALKKRGEQGRVAWKNRYTWKRITEDYLALYNQLINS